MQVTLYNPGQLPRVLPSDGFSLPNDAGFAQISNRVAEELGCIPNLIDVLDTGPGYVVYSIFDSEGEINQAAMYILSVLSGTPYDPNNEDEQLRGRILFVTDSSIELRQNLSLD